MPLSNPHTNFTTGSYQGDLLYLLKIAENNALRLNPTNAKALTIHVDSKNRPVIGYGYDLIANKLSAVKDLGDAGVVLSPTQIAAINSLPSSSVGIPQTLIGLVLPSEAAATALLNSSIFIRRTGLLGPPAHPELGFDYYISNVAGGAD